MISVIIPAYREEEFIEKTLLQLIRLRQEAVLEIIVSDGYSPDKTINRKTLCQSNTGRESKRA